MSVIGFLIGIEESKTGERAYRVVLADIVNKETEKEYSWKFKCQRVSEQGLIELRNKINITNVDIIGGKIKGKGASLERFKGRPLVILSQLVNTEGRIVGYKVADFSGKVSNLRVRDLVEHGIKCHNRDEVPVQNAIFVADVDDKRPHYKSYPGNPFIEELAIRTTKNPYVENRTINTRANEKTLMSKLEDIYTPEQLEQLRKGKQHGVQIKIYADPKLNYRQMMALRQGLEKGLNVRPYAHPDYSYDVMQFYNLRLSFKRDIKPYLNSKYNLQQLAELALASEEGLDISQMADPELPVIKMAERRIRMENNVFNIEDVEMEGSWA